MLTGLSPSLAHGLQAPSIVTLALSVPTRGANNMQLPPGASSLSPSLSGPPWRAGAAHLVSLMSQRRKGLCFGLRSPSRLDCHYSWQSNFPAIKLTQWLALFHSLGQFFSLVQPRKMGRWVVHIRIPKTLLKVIKGKWKSLSRVLLFATPWSLPGSSVHGILQARILEWVAIPFSRGSSQPRDQSQVSHMAGRFFISCSK